MILADPLKITQPTKRSRLPHRERPKLSPQPKCPHPFVQFPIAVVRDRRLKPVDVRVWGVMRSLSRRANGGVCDASQATIAEHCILSVSSVQRSQKRLSKCGWLTLYEPGGRTGGWRRDTHIYIVNDYPVAPKVDQSDLPVNPPKVDQSDLPTSNISDSEKKRPTELQGPRAILGDSSSTTGEAKASPGITPGAPEQSGIIPGAQEPVPRSPRIHHPHVTIPSAPRPPRPGTVSGAVAQRPNVPRTTLGVFAPVLAPPPSMAPSPAALEEQRAKLHPKVREVMNTPENPGHTWFAKIANLLDGKGITQGDYDAWLRYMVALEAPKRQREWEKEKAQALENESAESMWLAVKNATPDDRWTTFEKNWRQGQIKYRTPKSRPLPKDASYTEYRAHKASPLEQRAEWSLGEVTTLTQIYTQRVKRKDTKSGKEAV